MNTILDTPALLAGESPGVLAIVLRLPPDDAAFAECGRLAKLVGTRQARINLVMIVEKFAGKMSADRSAQQGFVKDLQTLGDRLIGTGVAVLSPGLKGTMIRLMVNSVVMLGLIRHPLQIHASIPHLMNWLLSLPGQSTEVRASSVRLTNELNALIAAGRDVAVAAPPSDVAR